MWSFKTLLMLQFSDKISLGFQCLLPHFFISVIYCIISLSVIVSALSSWFIFVFFHKLIHFSNGWLYLCLTISREERAVRPPLCQTLLDTFLRSSLHSPTAYDSWILTWKNSTCHKWLRFCQRAPTTAFSSWWQGGKAVPMPNIKTKVMIERRGVSWWLAQLHLLQSL